MSLVREFNFYRDNKNALLKDFDGKFIVIKEGKVIGSYDTELQAYLDSSKAHELGTFLIQKCEVSSDEQSFHSRVSFA